MKLEFSEQVLEKNIPISYSMNILSVGAELFHAEKRTDRQTHMEKLIVAFAILRAHP
jgi:hypothetical protein